MTNEDFDAATVHDPVVARNRRRKQAIAGVAGLAVLGAGSFLVASELTDSARTETRDTAVSAPIAPEAPVTPEVTDSASASASASAEPSASSASAEATSPPAEVSPSPTRSRSRQEQIDAVKGTAAKADNVKRPVAPVNANKVATNVKVSQSGSLKEGGTLKVVSARQDLTGQRELSIVGDEGEAVGAARCTQKIRFADGARSVEKPTMLICWRTSAERSVYTVAVVPKGRPAADRSVAAIAKQWSKLG